MFFIESKVIIENSFSFSDLSSPSRASRSSDWWGQEFRFYLSSSASGKSSVYSILYRYRTKMSEPSVDSTFKYKQQMMQSSFFPPFFLHFYASYFINYHNHPERGNQLNLETGEPVMLLRSCMRSFTWVLADLSTDYHSKGALCS